MRIHPHHKVTRRELALACVAAAQRAHTEPSSERLPPVSIQRVLIVRNLQSPDSVAIAGYYASRRKAPQTHVCSISCPTQEECKKEEYDRTILAPIRQFIASRKLDVDYILLTKGIPIRVSAGGFAVDSMLATLDWTLLTDRTTNPYFNKTGRFTHKKYNLYLVTRLDGYTRAECLRLVDNALKARPVKGPFLLHPDFKYPSNYRVANDSIREANRILREKGFETIYNESGPIPPGRNLAGYFTWAHNFHGFDREEYRRTTFVPGALAETVVSTSGRTFSDPEARGQSLIADLIRQGVTGAKGYVSEPYVDAIARAHILFDRYTSGYTLAESFYAASQFVYWKDVVIGDPICAPYALPRT